jgi:hypothetical protein
VIGAYVVGSFVLCSLLFILLIQNGFISDRCISTDQCTRRDELMMGGPLVAWLVICLLCVGFGWRGRLFGCRAARV